MIELLRGLMARIFAGGVICAAAMVLAGDGARREIVRLCCACLMIIFILTPVQGVSLSLDTLADDRADIEGQINRALGVAQDIRLESISAELAAHVESRCAALGITGKAQVSCHTGPEGALVIDGITVLYQSAGAEDLAALTRRLTDELDLAAGSIILREAQGP